MKVMTAAPDSFIRRIWIYSREMFPILIYLPYIIALYICLNFSAQVISGHNIVVDVYGVVGMVSAFFMMLLMRTFDDLKDIEIDKDLFPERATSRGAVLKSDISILSVTSFSVLVIVNVIFARETLIVFAIMMLYALLTFKWFFAEKIHRENVFLTMVTHQPVPYVVNLYLIYTALASGGNYDHFTVHHFFLLLIYSLPVTAWEVSRKIRSADVETDYETFSMVFGARGATLIAFVCLIITSVLCFFTGLKLDLGLSYFVVVTALLLFVMFYYVRFLVKPVNAFNVMKNVTMIYTTLIFLNMLIHILMKFSIKVGI